MFRAYYIDQPLSEAESAEVAKSLGLSNADSVEQALIPGPWPRLSWRDIASSDTSHHLQAATHNLRRAGILRDKGRSVGLIIPHDQFWGAICATAILRLTGECPMAVQPWVAGDDGPVRGLIQIFGFPDVPVVHWWSTHPQETAENGRS